MGMGVVGGGPVTASRSNYLFTPPHHTTTPPHHTTPHYHTTTPHHTTPPHTTTHYHTRSVAWLCHPRCSGGAPCPQGVKPPIHLFGWRFAQPLCASRPVLWLGGRGRVFRSLAGGGWWWVWGAWWRWCWSFVVVAVGVVSGPPACFALLAGPVVNSFARSPQCDARLRVECSPVWL